VVLIDGSRCSLAALHSASELAAHWQAELLALFVEEQDLLRCAGYPWTREIGLSGAVRRIDVEELEASMRNRAEQARNALEQCARSSGLSWHLHISRGRVVQQTLDLVQAEDVLVLGRVGYARARGLRLGSTAREMARQAPGPVIVCEHQDSTERTQAVRSAVLIEAAETGLETLEASLPLMIGNEVLAAVILDLSSHTTSRSVCAEADPKEATSAEPAPRQASPSVAATDEGEIRAWLHKRYPQAKLITTTYIGETEVARLVAHHDIDRIIISRRHPLIACNSADSLVERLSVPLLVLPPSRAP
jgi:nucleotide-binding universal stress UspA family protein